MTSKFLEALRKSARVTYRTGREAGFEIYRIRGKQVIGKVKKGSLSSMSPWIGEESDPLPLSHQAVGDIHFHPEPEVPFPSIPDISALICGRGEELDALLLKWRGVGAVWENGDVQVIFLKGNTGIASYEIISDELKRRLSRKEEISLLREFGFKVTLLTFKGLLRRK